MTGFGRRFVIGAASCALATGVLATTPAAFADTGGSTLVQDFSSSVPNVSDNWLLPNANGTDETNDACLVPFEGESPTAPIVDCADQSGAQPGLQLTPDATDQEGGAAWGTSVPTSRGLDINFTSYQYPGAEPDLSPADGISFFLAASDPSDPTDKASAVTLGPPGADLGYSANPGDGASGLSNAYLGVGLDVFGNFSNSDADDNFTPTNDETNCAGVDTQSGVHTNVTESLDVRGPGDGTTGYCLMNSTKLDDLDNGGVLDGLDGNENPAPVPVEIVINSTSSSVTTASGFQVPAGQYLVNVTMTDGNQHQETGQLPDATSYAGDNTSGWYDDGGVPKQLTFGWAASTGADREFHTISNLNVASLAPVPQLGVSVSDNSHTTPTGQPVTYAATVTDSVADETRPITVTSVFSPGLTPKSANLPTGCGIDSGDPTGQTVSCVLPNGLTQGNSATIAVPVDVDALPAGTQKSLSDQVTVGASDAVPATATDTETYSGPPPITATHLVFTTQPQNATVNQSQDVKVTAEDAQGNRDPNYSGPVTLTFHANPGNAQFIQNNQTSQSLTSNAANGIADFGVAVTKVGFGYRLDAASAPLTAAAPSNSFDVNSAQTTCPTGTSCTTGTVTSTVPGTSAVVTEPSGQGTLTASFGGNVAPIHPCTNTAPAILTFSGTAQKVIKYTYKTPLLNPFVCYGQPTRFTDFFLIKTTYFSQANQEYEGLLPLCLPKLNGPCISGLSWSKGSETVTIQSSANDPHTIPSG